MRETEHPTCNCEGEQSIIEIRLRNASLLKNGKEHVTADNVVSTENSVSSDAHKEHELKIIPNFANHSDTIPHNSQTQYPSNETTGTQLLYEDYSPSDQSQTRTQDKPISKSSLKKSVVEKSRNLKNLKSCKDQDPSLCIGFRNKLKDKFLDVFCKSKGLATISCSKSCGLCAEDETSY